MHSCMHSEHCFLASLAHLRFGIQAWHKVLVLKLEELQEICWKNTGDFGKNENPFSSKNTEGNANFTGVTGDYRGSCHAWIP